MPETSKPAAAAANPRTLTADASNEAGEGLGQQILRVLGVTIAAVFSGAAIGIVTVLVTGSDAHLWLIARATGLMSYALLTVVTISGLLLAVPHRGAVRFLAPATRLRTHIIVTIFALVFTVIHIVVLAIDPWANVGWAGALLPFGAEYRPVPVTVGLMSLWAGIISGVTAGFAGRGTGRWWRPLHRLAGVAWVLAWLHGVFAGSDTGALLGMYAITGLLVIVLATWRYSAGRRSRIVARAAVDGMKASYS